MSRRSIGIPCATMSSAPNQEGMSRLEEIAGRRAIPGVVLFSGTGEILFMNSEAELLNRQISGTGHGENGPETLPAEVLELYASLRKVVTGSNKDEPQEQHELRRVAGDANSPILLRAFPLSIPSENDDACMLILMEKLGRERRVVPGRAKDSFRLTDREVEIVRYISEGWTNKEIARYLKISEHTVKEHVRHLLKKTKTTTRTGILAQIFQDI